MTTTKETVELYLMPVPAETFDEAAARSWLREDARSWVAILGEALNSPDKKMRAAFAVLATDVEHCLEAASQALEGKPECIVEHDFDPKHAIPDLSRMASFRPRDGDPGDYFEHAQALLRAELLRYLDAEGGGGTEDEGAD